MLWNDALPHLRPAKGAPVRFLVGNLARHPCLAAALLLGLCMLSLTVSCASEVDVEKLYVQSNSDDYEERVEARQILNQLVSEGNAGPFAQGLRSENAETRVQSILYLMSIKNEAAKKALLGELELSRRFNVFYNPIRMLPASKPSDSRIMIAHVIFLEGGDPQAVAILEGTYGKEPDAEARVGTMYALGALADPRAIPALRKALRDPEVKVVRAAVEGLNQLHAQDVAENLVGCLTDRNDQIRKNCATVLSGFPGEKTLGGLMGAVKKDPSEEVRLAALSSLGFAGGLDAFEFILGVLRSGDSSAEMKGKAATALQSISNQDFGKDAGAWARWYEQNRPKIARP